ncbi:diguanylate cyclase [Proteobacteria bacterium 005FR1]|nr:diguanylate cyclase [Proteobacteria bacterium 005FR1]
MHSNKKFFAVALSALLLVGFIATSLISYYVAKDSTGRQLQEQMLPLTSDNIYSEIQRDLLQPVLISSLMANDTFVNEWARGGEGDPQRMANYLAHIRQKYNAITSFFVSEKTRNYYHPSGIIKQVDPSDTADAWYFRARESSDEYEINIDRDTADPSRLSIFVNYRIIDQSGRFIGITGVGLSLNTVAELIENYQKRYGREIFFVNREGDITLRSSNFDEQLHLKNRDGLNRLFTRVLTSPSASVSYELENGNTVYLNSRLVPEFDWFLVVEQINDPATERIEGALLVNVLISVGISVVVLLIAYFTVAGYQRRLETMATQDKLTGATNRQVFDVIFNRAAKRADRAGTPLSLIAMDIDNFKDINDTYGHQRGDEVIRAVAQVIEEQVREVDTLCRWGGEEFVLLLENCDRDQAFDVAEKIRRAVAEHTFRFGADMKSVTVSLGVAERRKNESQDSLQSRCDHAMYRSKGEGRNRVNRG